VGIAGIGFNQKVGLDRRHPVNYIY